METVLIPLVEKFSRSRLTAIGDLASGSLQDSPLSEKRESGFSADRENQAGNTFASYRQLNVCRNNRICIQGCVRCS